MSKRKAPSSEEVQQSAPAVSALLPMTPDDAPILTTELLETCRAWIRRYTVVSDEQAVIMAAWVMHTYVFEAFEVTPYLFISSPEKGSGKSTLLRILKAVAYRGRSSSGMSAAALARVVEASRPTLFLDELDAQMKGNKETAENIRGVLNSGYEPEGVYTRCVGNEFAVKDFPTLLPEMSRWHRQTLGYRFRPLDHYRNAPDAVGRNNRARSQGRGEGRCRPNQGKVGRMGGTRPADLLRSIHPSPISGFNPRQNDIAEVQLAVAQLAGGGWPQEDFTQALQALLKAASVEDGSIGVTLLADIRAVFDEQQTDTVPSAILAGCLPLQD